MHYRAIGLAVVVLLTGSYGCLLIYTCLLGIKNGWVVVGDAFTQYKPDRRRVIKRCEHPFQFWRSTVATFLFALLSFAFTVIALLKFMREL
jgi:hypothetical protein